MTDTDRANQKSSYLPLWRPLIAATALMALYAAVKPAGAFAQDAYGPALDLYAEPKAGVTFFDTNIPGDPLNTDTDPGYAIGGALGLADPVTGLRGEAEILYQRAGFDLGPSEDHLDALNLSANAYFDLPVDGPIKPYIGGGIGTARVGVDIDGITNDADWVFTYNAQAGVTYDLYRGGQLTAGYRYTSFADADISGLFGPLETESHVAQVGYRMGF